MQHKYKYKVICDSVKDCSVNFKRNKIDWCSYSYECGVDVVYKDIYCFHLKSNISLINIRKIK